MYQNNALGMLISEPSYSASGLEWSGVGPDEVAIHVRSDGGIMFDFSASNAFVLPQVPQLNIEPGMMIPKSYRDAEIEYIRKAHHRLTYMNAWIASFTSAMAEVKNHYIFAPPPVDPWRHYKIWREREKWILVDQSNQIISGGDDPSGASEEVFEYCLSVMSAAKRRFEDYVVPLALLHLASFQFQRHQFSSALIGAWTLCEAAIDQLWREYQESVSSGNNVVTEINKNRRKLLNGRDYTASIKTQILSLGGRISDNTLADLDATRKVRNDFMHSLREVDYHSAQKAVQTACEMITNIIGCRVDVPLGINRWI